MNRHVMHVPQTSLQGSCKLGDGADLLHGPEADHHPEVDHQKPRANRLGYQEPLQIRRPLKLRSQAVIVSADHLYRVDASAAHPWAAAEKIPGTSGAQPSFQTADGAQKILAANGRSVTQALTAGKPVDTRKTGNVSRTARIAGKAGNPALAANTPFWGAFPQSVEKGGDSLHLRKCGGRP